KAQTKIASSKYIQVNDFNSLPLLWVVGCVRLFFPRLPGGSKGHFLLWLCELKSNLVVVREVVSQKEYTFHYFSSVNSRKDSSLTTPCSFALYQGRYFI